MLHAIELENFKAFGKRARIPFAPITLIFGENSAGKSTILQALNLLKQTRESKETAANYQMQLFDRTSLPSFYKGKIQ
ncbi:hypothetical protein C6496_22285 [Candidatus Poribacteria bacterium]|nr:MAG: hypothetical protein C6496_22285 [Candidatus Poribacteria bacterium]